MATNITDRIQKLLAKANDPACTQPEAEAFWNKAQELIKKHAIDAETLAQADPTQREKVVIRRIFGDVKGTRLIKARREMIRYLADLNSVQLIAHGKNGRNAMSIVGHESDVELIMMVFTSMMLQMDTALSIARRNGEVIGASGPVSYAHGWVRRVGQRLIAAKAEAAASATDAEASKALVLVDRSAVVQMKVSETWPKLYAGRRSTTSVRDYDAYRAGDRDGQRADIGGTRIDGRTGRPELS